MAVRIRPDNPRVKAIRKLRAQELKSLKNSVARKEALNFARIYEKMHKLGPANDKKAKSLKKISEDLKAGQRFARKAHRGSMGLRAVRAAELASLKNDSMRKNMVRLIGLDQKRKKELLLEMNKLIQEQDFLGAAEQRDKSRQYTKEIEELRERLKAKRKRI